MNLDEYWDELVERGIAADEELQLVTSGWGYTLETLETVLYVRTGYRSFEQIEVEDEDA